MKSVKLEVRERWDRKSRYIKIAGPGLTASTVSNDPWSKRYHPNLFKKLAKVLEKAGVAVPGA